MEEMVDLLIHGVGWVCVRERERGGEREKNRWEGNG
jgi:hypothetical protein